jgi:hypothetical protein
MAETATDNIKRGGLGKKKILREYEEEREQGKSKKRRYRRQFGFFRTLQRKGLLTDRYGFPPPYGILSGRFIGMKGSRGIYGTWKLGRRAT